MHTIIMPSKSERRSRRQEAPASAGFRHPHYECDTQDQAVRLTVYVPGVDASGVEIVTQGPDIEITARKSHVLRVNWQSLHLERAQRDYRLRLRLGRGLDYDALQAELRDGTLTIVLPKQAPVVTGTFTGRRKVASAA